MRNGFYTHLSDAIKTNKRRRSIYASRTQGKSLKLSNGLIFSEQICLPIAAYFDCRAKAFNQKGIPIIQNDFVSMAGIKNPESMPIHKSTVQKDEWVDLKCTLKTFQKEMLRDVNNGCFEEICQCSACLLKWLGDTEHRVRAHFAMTKHIVESIGFSALNAIAYSRQSEGGTTDLSKKLITLQGLGVDKGLLFDRTAQKIHRLNVGIILNDIPSIPFLKDYKNHKGWK